MYSLYSALLTAYAACWQYQAIGKLVQPDQIRRSIRTTSESDDLAGEIRLPEARSVVTLSVNQFFLYTSITSFLCGFGGYFASIHPDMVKFYQFSNTTCWVLFGISTMAEANMRFESPADILYSILETRRAHNQQRTAEEGRQTACSPSNCDQDQPPDDSIEVAVAEAEAEGQIPMTCPKGSRKSSASVGASSGTTRSQPNATEIT